MPPCRKCSSYRACASIASGTHQRQNRSCGLQPHTVCSRTPTPVVLPTKTGTHTVTRTHALSLTLSHSLTVTFTLTLTYTPTECSPAPSPHIQDAKAAAVELCCLVRLLADARLAIDQHITTTRAQPDLVAGRPAHVLQAARCRAVVRQPVLLQAHSTTQLLSARARL